MVKHNARKNKPVSRISGDIPQDTNRFQALIRSNNNSYGMQSGNEKFSWKLFLVLCLIIAIAIVVCFSNTLTFGLVFNDQFTFDRMQPLLSDSENWGAKLAIDALKQPLTQPWLQYSFAQDFFCYGRAFGWYHLVNIFLHLSSCLALFCLVLRICWRLRKDERTTSDPWKVAIAAALIYACHPLAVQPVTYITGRYMALSGANFFIALNTFLLGLFGQSGAARCWGYGLTVLFGLMALTSNEVALALPFTMLSLFFLIKPDRIKWKDWLLSHPLVGGILAALSLCLPFSYYLGFHPGFASDFYGMPELSKLAYTATQAKALFTYYTRCFFLPLGISLDPPYSQAKSWADPFSLGGVLFIFTLLYLIARYRRFTIFVFGLIIVIAGYLPHACIVQQEAVADPVFYVSLAGMSIVAGWVLTEIIKGSYRQVITGAAPIMILLIVASILRNIEWSSDDRLFASTVRTNESSAPALTWWGQNCLVKKNFSKALSLADQAIVNNQRLAMAYMVKGEALTALHKADEAKEALIQADNLATRQKLKIAARIKLDLAENDLRSGKPLEAEHLVLEALNVEPVNLRSVFIMGMAAYEQGVYDKAYMLLKRAAEQGLSDALPALADCSIRMHNYEEALSVAQAAVKYQDSAQSQMALGQAMFANQQFKTAEEAFKKVLKLNQKDPAALAYLALIYDQKGDKVLSNSYMTDAIKIEPQIFSHIALPQNENGTRE